MVAPILSFTTEEIYSLLKINSNKSIHLENFPKIPSKWNNQDLEVKWNKLIKIREICNSSIELKRASKEIGSSLETNLIIYLNESNKNKIVSILESRVIGGRRQFPLI